MGPLMTLAPPAFLFPSAAETEHPFETSWEDIFREDAFMVEAAGAPLPWPPSGAIRDSPHYSNRQPDDQPVPPTPPPRPPAFAGGIEGALADADLGAGSDSDDADFDPANPDSPKARTGALPFSPEQPPSSPVPPVQERASYVARGAASADVRRRRASPQCGSSHEAHLRFSM